MAETTIPVDLDPKKVLDSVRNLKQSIADLADDIETSLGKRAPKSVEKLEEAAQKGTTRISTYFRNLGTRVKEDLKTAFATTEILGGAKFAKELGSGVKQVFEMERAFDRLNARLGLTHQAMTAFKKSLGQKVSGTGQKLEDILPGVETAAAKGGIKSPEQLSAIGEALGKVKATTGEGVENVADTVVEILKNQGQAITAESFKKTLDAIQGTRTAGAFKTAGEAGGAIENLSPYGKQFGLNTRQLGGMAATAARGGTAGQDILKQLLERASKAGGATALNSIFGQEIFKAGGAGQAVGVNPEALGKINTKKFGAASAQVLEESTGLTGATGQDLVRFVDSFKTGMADFNKVTQGANETATQFSVATDNLASTIDQFKERTKEIGREIGGGLSQMVKDLKERGFQQAWEDLKGVAKTSWENKGTLATGIGVTAAVGALAGGGMRSLLGKLGGPLGGVIGGAAAEAAGISKVFVVNMPGAFGGGGGVAAAGGAAGALGKAGLAAATGLVAYEATSSLISGTALGGGGANGGLGGAIYDYLHPDELKSAIKEGAKEGMSAGRFKPHYTNPSDVTGRGTSK